MNKGENLDKSGVRDHKYEKASHHIFVHFTKAIE